MKKIAYLFNLFLLSFCCSIAHAELIPGTTLSVEFQSGQIVGSGRNINMHRVPVIDVNTGQTVFYDAAFKFSFTPQSGLIFEQISSAIVSPPQSIANIIPGIYKTQTGFCYILEGPTIVDGNRSLYTLRGFSDQTGCHSSTDFFTAQFISGAPENHPDIGNREIVPFLPDTYMYGFVTDDGRHGSQPINSGWDQNELVGIRQSGNQFIIGLFSEGVNNDGVPNDFAEPRESVILTKVIE